VAAKVVALAAVIATPSEAAMNLMRDIVVLSLRKPISAM
jgi:hypothetical protein